MIFVVFNTAGKYMDLIYRTGKYRDTLKRVRSMRTAPATADQAEQALDQLQDEVEQILGHMRTDHDYDASRVHYALLFAAVAVVGVAFAITQNAILTPLYVLLGLVAFIWLSHRLMRVTINQYSSPPSDRTGVSQQIQFAKNGIVIKKRRLLLLSIFYILFFPILMLFLQTIGMGPLDGIHPILNFFLALAISTGMWIWYYNLAFDQYDDIEETLDLIQEQVG